MNILVLGGTRFAGVHLVRTLLTRRHTVTIATRGLTPDEFGDRVRRKVIQRQSTESLAAAFRGEYYDAVIDNLAYSSNDVRALLDAVRTARYVLTSTVSVYGDFHMEMREDEMDTTSCAASPCGWTTRTSACPSSTRRRPGIFSPGARKPPFRAR